MTTFAAPQDIESRQAELEAWTAAAWTAYRDELRGLAGQDYADAEAPAWDRLQAALLELRSPSAQPEPGSDGP